MPKQRLTISSIEVLSYIYKNTLIPELVSVLGEETTVEFIKIFSGQKISIPKYEEISEFERNLDIYETLSILKDAENTKLLAKKYDITEVWVREIFKKMRREYPKMLNFLAGMENQEKIMITTKREPILYGHKRSTGSRS